MQAVFQNAVFHQEPIVLGVKLLPLSLWHVYALMAAESPYVTQGCSAHTLFDLSLAVSICARTKTDGERWLNAPDLKEVAKWGRRWGRNWQTWEDGAAEHGRFVEYLENAIQMPKRWSKKDAADAEIKNPWPLIIVTKLSEKCGEEKAWNMPLPMAISLWSAESELQGDTSLMSEREEAAIRKARAMREQAAVVGATANG